MPSFTPRRPYLYPVYGPDQISLTEVGKPHDPTGSHGHHYSLWIAHHDVGGHDFWSERGGLIVHRQFELMEDGPLFARLVVRAEWRIGSNYLLDERRTITVHATPEAFRVIDIDTELSVPGSESVKLGQTNFGFLSARVAQPMTVYDGAGEITNAKGQRDEQGAFGQRAAWIDQSGPIADSKWGGVALMDCPDNPRYPTAWHCRDDGWAGTSFCRDEPWTISPDKPLRLRYRVLLHRHNAEDGQVARRYTEFTARPTIQLGAVQITG
jgi:hypothetical protein